MSEVTQILSQIDSGDPQAAAQLLPLVCDDLRRLAESDNGPRGLPACRRIEWSFFPLELLDSSRRLIGVTQFPTLEGKKMKTVAIVLLFALTAMISTDAWAKRTAPKDVKPIVHEGVKYLTPHDNGREGKIIAEDEKTGKKLWEAVVYKVKIDPNLEEDVQWVFISGLELHGNKLIVSNEKGDSYAVDIKTKKVEKLRKK
jgi:hypothetical protein